MKVFHTVSGLRDDLNKDRRRGLRIGFVPTMGNLHQGHLALVKQARETNDIVVCSIFVNALQFGLNEDWDKYPRTYESDCEKLRESGCDYLFHPDDIEMYPNGLDTQSRVICPTMTDMLCGASRPGHFEGVTTVVSKLFNIVQPDEAVFGIKDYQQLAVIRRMAEDLCMPVQISAAPIHREADGLAMSSRNSYITDEERPRVTVLKQSLEWIAEQIQDGSRDFSKLEQSAGQQLIDAGFALDYITISNSKTLEPAADDDIEITILGAMFTEKARLIDNLSIVLN
ncbi:pantoate--beta-alanine ligase [SAR92 clade bacterium H231]|jgi:pantoate--beta-alanine ligase|nr:pantoate--beta-alanine ligase [Porticoccaceae bacterium]MCT2533896.1 pantoate--beta-alanine ligase [SAR92 clade bacterium H231]MBT7259341.1 pantoate--beta-alanine ligase [Porticoccaceae bacterium]MBT7904558.1 pantoate--beta-alanine ligase [Porticoccaceae bacterium]MDA7815836.1 pantoate--beta-alanine ligase [Porticoccaceae bacterium]